MIGDCYFCKKKNVEGREHIVKQYNAFRNKKKVTSQLTVLMCKECDPLLKPKLTKPWDSYEYKMDGSRYGR